MEEDCSELCNQTIARCENMMSDGHFHKARAVLLQLELKVRLLKDVISTRRVIVTICKMHFQSKNWEGLAHYLNNMATYTVGMQYVSFTAIAYCITYLDNIETNRDKMLVLSAMRNVSFEKTYLYKEYFCTTIHLSRVHVDESNFSDAIMHLIQLETYTMSWKEKVMLFIEKMRLYIMLGNHMDAGLVAHDISMLLIDKEGADELKISYHKLMADLKSCEQNYIVCAEHYEEVLKILSAQPSNPARIEAAKAAVLYSLLARNSLKQEQLMERIFRHDALCLIPLYKNLMLLFISGELINWESICHTYGTEFRTTDVFGNYPLSMKRWMDFRNSVVEHNIRVLAGCQQHMSIVEMSNLLRITPMNTKYHLSLLMLNGVVNAVIDHDQDVVHFLPLARPRQNIHSFDPRLTVIAFAALAFPMAQSDADPRQNVSLDLRCQSRINSTEEP